MTNTYNDQIQKLSLMELMMEWKHISELIKDHSTSLQTLNDKERLIEELIKEKDKILEESEKNSILDGIEKAHEEQSKDEYEKQLEEIIIDAKELAAGRYKTINFPVNPNKPKVSVENTTPEIKSVMNDINGREIDLDTEIKNISFIPVDHPSAQMINTRIINTLAKENIVFLDEIVVLDEASLLRIDGISTTTVRHIKEFLRANKLTLKD